MIGLLKLGTLAFGLFSAQRGQLSGVQSYVGENSSPTSMPSHDHLLENNFLNSSVEHPSSPIVFLIKHGGLTLEALSTHLNNVREFSPETLQSIYNLFITKEKIEPFYQLAMQATDKKLGTYQDMLEFALTSERSEVALSIIRMTYGRYKTGDLKRLRDKLLSQQDGETFDQQLATHYIYVVGIQDGPDAMSSALQSFNITDNIRQQIINSVALKTVQTGEEALLRHMVENEHADLTARFSFQITCATECIKNFNQQVFDYLSGKGIDWGFHTDEGVTLLHTAVVVHSLPALRALLKTGVKFDAEALGLDARALATCLGRRAMVDEMDRYFQSNNTTSYFDLTKLLNRGDVVSARAILDATIYQNNPNPLYLDVWMKGQHHLAESLYQLKGDGTLILLGAAQRTVKDSSPNFTSTSKSFSMESFQKIADMLIGSKDADPALAYNMAKKNGDTHAAKILGSLSDSISPSFAPF
jgi:hypothetical protein